MDIEQSAKWVRARLGPYSGLKDGARSWRDLNDDERDELARAIASAPPSNFGTRITTTTKGA